MGAAVFVLAFATYVLSLAPGLGWLDAPEFVAASADLGIPHSPGHPLHPMLGRVAGYLPVGDLAFRVNLLSALCSALACTAVFAAARELILELTTQRGKSRQWTAALVGVAVALSPALWQQAVRAEVYGLATLLTATLVWMTLMYLRTADARVLIASALVLAFAPPPS